jgi:hypothetical protein
VDDVLGLLGLSFFSTCLLFLLHLMRATPRNKGMQHGGGFDGAYSIWGYPPLDDDPKMDRQQKDGDSEAEIPEGKP